MVLQRTPSTSKKLLAGGLLAAALLTLTTTAAMAQRDPAYESARKSGQVGEQTDGYLGIIGSATPAVRDMVRDINIKRKAAYTERASATGSTVEQFAFTSGCNLISKTQPGEKYQTPDGNWQTRDASAPQRDPRCL